MRNVSSPHRVRPLLVLGVAGCLFACQSPPSEPASRSSASEPSKQPAAAPTPSPTPPAASAALIEGEVTEAELDKLPYPPFPGSHQKRFLRQPSWRRPGGYTLTVEGAAKIDDVAGFYLKRAKATDPAAESEHVQPTYVRLRSIPSSITVDITVAKDGKTVTAQIGYGMF